MMKMDAVMENGAYGINAYLSHYAPPDAEVNKVLAM